MSINERDNMNVKELEKAYLATPEYQRLMVAQQIAQFFITEARLMEDREFRANELAKATPEYKAWAEAVRFNNSQKRREEAAKAQERKEQADRSAQLTADWKASLKAKERDEASTKRDAAYKDSFKKLDQLNQPNYYSYTVEFLYVDLRTDVIKKSSMTCSTELEAYRESHKEMANLFGKTGKYSYISDIRLIVKAPGF